MHINAYLNFDGQCAEAFRFYEQVLGGTLDMTTHGESPIASEVPPEWHDRVIHARLEVGDAVLMASDSPPGMYERPQGVYVSINLEDMGEADRIFHALAEEGTVTMEIDQTFWARRFGMLTDRFGIHWMVNCA